MKRKSTATAALDSQLGRAMRKMLEQMEKSEERKEKSEDREAEDYRRGGKVLGPGTATSDSILARISNGEYILPKPAVDMVGANNLEAIRRAALARTPGYALGGLAFGGSGINTQTPGEYTATTFAPSTTVNPMTTGTAIGGGVRQSSAQPTGTTNQYGNDMSLTNRMNAGTDQLRAMRTGLPVATPTTLQQPDFMTGLRSLLNPQQQAQQQAQDAYKAARGRADALDVASGRFDREYAPGFKDGGMVSKEQWEGLPRFVLGGRAWTPSQLVSVYGPNPPVSVPTDIDLARVAAQRAADTAKATAAMSGPASAAPLVPGGYGAAPSIGSRIVSGLGSLGARAAGGIGMMLYPSELGQGTLDSPEAQRAMAANKMAWRGDVPETIDMKSSTPIPAQTSRTLAVAPTPNPDANPAIAPSLSQAILPSPGQEASRRMGLKQLTTDLDRAALRAAGAYQVPGTDIYRQVESAPGFGPANPNRVPAPGQIAGTTTYTVPGETGMGGGPGQATFQGLPKQGGSLGLVGTPETKGMTQAEATAYNVANLNRQYEALKSRNEAYGLGGGNVGSALPVAPAPVDIWARPGDSFGDSQMRQAQYESLLNNAGKQRGVGAKRRAAAMIDAAQALVAPGVAAAKLNAEQEQAMTQGLMGLQASERQMQASERQKAIAAQQAQQAAEQAQKNWDAQFNFNRTKAQVDAMEKDRTYLMNVLKATPDLDDNAMLKIREQFMRDVPPTKENPTGGKAFNEQEFRGALGVETFTGNTQPRPGKVYYKEDENAYMLATPEGLVPIGGPDEYLRYRHRQIQQQQRNALLGR